MEISEIISKLDQLDAQANIPYGTTLVDLVDKLKKIYESSSKVAVTAQVAAVADRLETLLSQSPEAVTHGGQRALIRLAQFRNDHESVIQRTREFERMVGKKDDEILYARVVAMYRSWQWNSVGPDLAALDHVQGDRLLDRIRKELLVFDGVGSIYRSAAAGKLNINAGDRSSAHSNVLDCSVKLGVPEIGTSFIPESYEVSSSSADACGPPCYVRMATPKIILCSGFRWSGGSAVRDYLISLDGVEKFQDKIRFIDGSEAGLKPLLDVWASTANQHHIWRAWYDFFMKHVLGVDLSAKSLKERVYAYRRSFVASSIVKCNQAHVASALRSLGASLLLSNRTSTKPSESIVNLILSLVSERKPVPQAIVLDSALRAWNASFVRYMGDAKMIAVFRDPRDMFVTLVAHSNRRVTAAQFIETFQERIASFKVSMMDPSVSAKVKAVRFEKFILDGAYRESIARWLDISSNPSSCRSAFDAGVSKRNVGVHRGFQDFQAIREIEGALREYCWDF